MRIFGTGIDIVEVERIESAIHRHGEAFLARVFTAAEREYCDSHRRPALHFAARFAAKEAAAKALRTGIGKDAAMTDLEVVHHPGSAPSLRLNGAAAEFARLHHITEIQISLTHASAYAAASAIAMTD